MRVCVALTLGIIACAPAPDARDSAAAKVPGAPPEPPSFPVSIGPPERPAGPVDSTPPTIIVTALPDPVLSTVVKAGDTITVQVVGNVMDGDSNLVIPSTSPVRLRVDRLEGRAGANTARIAFTPLAVIVRDQVIPLQARIGPVAHVVRPDGVVIVDRGTEIELALTKRLVVQP